MSICRVQNVHNVTQAGLIGSVVRDKENKCMTIAPGLVSCLNDQFLVLDEIDKATPNIQACVTSLANNSGDVKITKVRLQNKKVYILGLCPKIVDPLPPL